MFSENLLQARRNSSWIGSLHWAKRFQAFLLNLCTCFHLRSSSFDHHCLAYGDCLVFSMWSSTVLAMAWVRCANATSNSAMDWMSAGGGSASRWDDRASLKSSYSTFLKFGHCMVMNRSGCRSRILIMGKWSVIMGRSCYSMEHLVNICSILAKQKMLFSQVWFLVFEASRVAMPGGRAWVRLYFARRLISMPTASKFAVVKR